jgi:hypothetical protein
MVGSLPLPEIVYKAQAANYVEHYAAAAGKLACSFVSFSFG